MQRIFSKEIQKMLWNLILNNSEPNKPRYMNVNVICPTLCHAVLHCKIHNSSNEMHACKESEQQGFVVHCCIQSIY